MRDLYELVNEIQLHAKSLSELHKKADRAFRMSTMLHNKEVQVVVCEDANCGGLWGDAPILRDIFKDIDLRSTALPYIRDRLAELHREIEAEYEQWKSRVNAEVA